MSGLAPGSRVGVFEVIGLLGEGGMGKVYRARDTRLNRDVALKILPDAFAADPDRLARFTREAQTLAALNHPHISHLHGLEESGNVRALVMELVEGEDLSQRISRGRMPPDEALPVARQIAEALEAAHEQGIIHRDLKPANIKVTPDGTVKVLDFGLAKALDPLSSASAGAMNSPTLSIHATQAGVILGTAAYMSPEQARGRPTDKRSDVWSFGCVLFEMLSGQRAFDGEDATEIIAAVVKTPPDWTALPADLPAHITTLIRRCLEKDRKLRIADIAVARFLMTDGAALETPIGVTAPSRSRAETIAAAGIAALLAIALATLAFIHFSEQPPATKAMRFQIPPPENSLFGTAAAHLSPDGTQLAFIARGPGGAAQLWVQPLDSLQPRLLAGTENATEPVWSPDSRFLAFSQVNRLKKIALAGGAPQTLCEFPPPWRGATWSRAGVIVLGVGNGGLMRVAETGGDPVPVTAVDTAKNERSHGAPWFLPDGRHFLYLRDAGSTDERTGIYLGSLDAAPDQQSAERLVASGYAPVFGPSLSSQPGWLLFVREGSLLAQPFNPNSRQLAGDAVHVADGFGAGPRAFSVSSNGILAYRIGASAGDRRLTWFDRSGKAIETVEPPGQYNTVALSPDGMRVAVSRSDTALSVPAHDLWTHDFARGTSTRLTFDPALDWLATWSPDGNSIIYTSARNSNNDLYRIGSNGAGKEELLLKSPLAEFAQDWSRDGRFLLYSTNGAARAAAAGNGLDLSALDLHNGAKPQPYLQSDFAESQGRFAPDGRYVAYTSNASGQNEVYVQTFPDPEGGKWLISRSGGVQPRWRRDGRELFFLSADSKMMAVDVTTSPVFSPGVPKPLFDALIWGGGQTTNVTRYDVAPDGQRFIINAAPPEARTAAVTVILNWEGIVQR